MSKQEQEIDDDVLRLADDIAGYLTTRRGAADTLEGLRSWWLFRQQLAVTDLKLNQAINYLDEHGLISKHRLPDGAVLYKNIENKESAGH